MATTALQGERSPTPSINGSANGQEHVSNGHSLSSSYTVTKEMTYEVVKQETTEDDGEQVSLLE